MATIAEKISTAVDEAAAKSDRMMLSHFDAMEGVKRRIIQEAADAGVLAELVVPENLAKELARQHLRDDAVKRFGEVT